MELRNIGLACVLGGLGVIASSMGACALDFNFYFDGDKGVVGTTKGIIKGVGDNGSLTGSIVTVTDSPFSQLNGQDFFFQGNGSFNINNGNITGGSGTFYYGASQVDLNLLNFLNGISYTSGNSTLQSFNTNGFAGVTYQAVATVPFDFNPAEGAALGVPLFIGLGVLRKKKLAKQSAARKVAELVS